MIPIQYYWRRFCFWVLGKCPLCWSNVNYTVSGTAICPCCRQRSNW